jgi:septal ring factor EnvC (AmiA/AmiB activator)
MDSTLKRLSHNRHIYAKIVVALCMMVGAAQALSAPVTSKQLKTIQQDIASLNTDIKLKKSNEQKIEHSLVSTEVEITKINQRLKPLAGQLVQEQDRLAQLQNQRQQGLNDLKQLQHALSQQIYAAYTSQEFSNHGLFLKIFFNQESPAKIPRYLEYYHALNGARLGQINKYRDTLSSLEQNQNDVAKQAAQLQMTQQQYQQEDQKLRLSLQERQGLLKKVRTEIQSDRVRLEQLKKNAQALDSKLKQLAKQQTQSRTRYVNTKTPPFNHYRGQLVWPTQGQIAHRFGTAIETSEMTWKGIVINTQPLQKVRAVAPGKVIFAEWLRGYGLLMIVDHGENYLTLYGRNNALYKKVGDIVKAGDTISEVGQTGGYDKPGLYFEVRYKGQPIDPQRWLLA